MQKSYEILVQKLNRFVRAYYRNLIFRGCIYSSISLFALLFLFAIIEHLSFLSGVVRSIFFWTYCLSTILIVIRFIVIPYIKMAKLTANHLSHKDAAKIIGLHFKEVSDKLTNILELKNLNEGSEALIYASIEQKIKEIQPTPFNKAIDWGATIKYSKYLLIPIVVILIFIVSGNKEIISNSTLRIINYNTHFEKPAPFYFNLEHDSLVAVEKNNLKILLNITGNEIPKEVSINYNLRNQKMKQVSETEFEYTFYALENNTKFYFSANNEFSKDYYITVLGRPSIEEIDIIITPPKHTGLNNEIQKNVSSIQVPQGSVVMWKIKTNKTDTLLFNNNFITKSNNGVFEKNQLILSDLKYEISLANSNVSFVDTTFYDVKTIKDAHPQISIQSKSDDKNYLPIITGFIQDDYGFSGLDGFARIYGLDRDTILKHNILINNSLRSQSFIYASGDILTQFSPGETIDFYFVVKDNDAPNNYKETLSEIITFNAPTFDEVEENYEKTNQEIKNNITAEMAIIKNLEKELSAFEKELIEKDSLDWRDRKKLEEILEKQAALEKKIDGLKETSKLNFEQHNNNSQPSKEILEKQAALEKLFNEIMPDEIKELYQELNKLKDQLSKEDLQQKLKKLQLSNEDLEKELDRNLEILKQVELDQKIENIIAKITQLEKEQNKLSQNQKDTPSKLESQKKHIEEFKKIQEDIKEMTELNKSLENKKKIGTTKNLEDAIESELEKGHQSLEKKQTKKASKSQKETGKKLQELANFFEKTKSENNESQHYEDMDVLRQILENLVYFSLEEESILLDFQDLEKDNPKYVELMHKQQDLRDAAKIIEDSLFALSKRVPQVSSKINREINYIDQKTGSAIDYLRERSTLKAVQEQQFIMTSANNLAVLLSNILEQMQQDMANDLPSTQQCEKPGKGSPKPGDLKKMQKQLSEHLEQMKQQMEQGEKNNMQGDNLSKKLVEMMAKQELIRESLEELRNEMKDKDGLNSLEKAIEEMEKTEKDIANNQITMESLLRQKEILTKLLEVEQSMREQGEDDKRESKTAISEYERILNETYEKYEQEKLRQTELLKTKPLQINDYYKQKVDRYFNLILK